MFNDPRGIAAAIASYGAPAQAIITNHGTDIWDTICLYADGARPADIIAAIAQCHNIAERTASQWFGAFNAYAKAARDTFNGPKAVLVKRGTRYELIDGANMADFVA